MSALDKGCVVLETFAIRCVGMEPRPSYHIWQSLSSSGQSRPKGSNPLEDMLSWRRIKPRTKQVAAHKSHDLTRCVGLTQ